MNKNAILSRIKKRHPSLGFFENAKEAAVVLPLIDNDGEWDILFEVRSSKLGLQPGDICFPGGIIEDGETSKVAAIRECQEELLIGESQIEVLGEIDATIGPNGSVMWAYAAILYDYNDTFSRDEVDEVFRVPLKELLNKGPVLSSFYYDMRYADDFPAHLVGISNDEKNKVYHNARASEVPFYEYKDKVIWGATGRILKMFLDRLSD